MYRETFGPVWKKLIRKRSDHRLKSWNSATDVRAWCFDALERRRYILSLLNGSVSKLQLLKSCIVCKRTVFGNCLLSLRMPWQLRNL